jgi:acetyltransferase EpsM
MKTKTHYIFGASGHGKVIAELAANSKCKINAIFDDNPKRNYFGETPIFNTIDLLNSGITSKLIIAIGDNFIRKKISERFKDFEFFKLIHKKAVISITAKIGEGTVIMVNAIVNAEAKIGKHVIVNSAAIVEHDCIIEDFVHISPGVILSGNIIIGEGTHIGSGATIIPGIKIGKWCVIGAGAVVISDIPDGATVVGNPGRIIKYNTDFNLTKENRVLQKV